MNQDINDIHDCTEYDPKIVTDDITGEVFCSTCAIVLKERTIDATCSPRMFSKEEYLAKTRNGMPSKISMFDMGNSSRIGNKDVDATGKYLSSKNRSHFLRLRLWDSRSKKSKERGLHQAFTVLDSIINRLGLPENAREHVARLYRKAAERNIIRGNSIRSVIAAIVYASCKQLEIPRSLDEVSHSANVRRKTLSRTYRRIVQELELDVLSGEIDYVSKVANSVKISEKARRTSSKILSDAKKSKIHVGKNPIGIAAASVYLSAIGMNHDISMAVIAKKTNISTVTIRKLTRLLRPFAAKYISTIEVSG